MPPPDARLAVSPGPVVSARPFARERSVVLPSPRLPESMGSGAGTTNAHQGRFLPAADALRDRDPLHPRVPLLLRARRPRPAFRGMAGVLRTRASATPYPAM